MLSGSKYFPFAPAPALCSPMSSVSNPLAPSDGRRFPANPPAGRFAWSARNRLRPPPRSASRPNPPASRVESRARNRTGMVFFRWRSYGGQILLVLFDLRRLKRRGQGQGTAAPEFLQVNLFAHQLANDGLLLFHVLVCVHHHKFEFAAHRNILFQDPPLEDSKTLIRVCRKPQVHARLKKLQLRAAFQNAVERHIQIRFE